MKKGSSKRKAQEKKDVSGRRLKNREHTHTQKKKKSLSAHRTFSSVILFDVSELWNLILLSNFSPSL